MLNSAPNKWTVGTFISHLQTGPQAGFPDGTWRPARPLGYFSLKSRLRLAWAVFTGEADALYWSDQSPPKAY